MRSAYDGVVSIFVHLPEPLRQSVHRQALEALRPGGVFLAEYFSREQFELGTGGPKNLAMLYTLEALRSDFTSESATMDLLEQVETDLQEGRYHRGRASVIRLVVRKRDCASRPQSFVPQSSPKQLPARAPNMLNRTQTQ